MSQLALPSNPTHCPAEILADEQSILELARRVDLVTRVTQQEVQAALAQVQDGTFPSFFLKNFLNSSRLPAAPIAREYTQLRRWKTPYSVQLNSNLVQSDRLLNLGLTLDIHCPTNWVADDTYTLRSNAVTVIKESNEAHDEFHEKVRVIAGDMMQSEPVMGALLMACADPHALHLLTDLEQFFPNAHKLINDVNGWLSFEGCKLYERNGVLVLGTLSVKNPITVVNDKQMSARATAPFAFEMQTDDMHIDEESTDAEGEPTPESSAEVEKLRAIIDELKSQLAAAQQQTVVAQGEARLAREQTQEAQARELAARAREQEARAALENVTQLAQRAEAHAAFMHSRLTEQSPGAVHARLPRA